MIVSGPSCGCPLVVISDMLRVRAASLASIEQSKSADTDRCIHTSLSRGNQPTFVRPGG